MSFIKVTDPRKREELIKDFIETRKRIKDNFIAQKVGEAEYQTGLTKLFKPVTETQKATTKEITEAQKATAKEITEAQKTTAKEITEAQKEATERIEKGLLPIQEALENPVIFRSLEKGDPIPAIEYTEKQKAELGNLAVNALTKTHGVGITRSDIIPYDPLNRLYKIADKLVKVEKNDIFIEGIDGIIYGTPGLWNLLISRDIPDKKEYLPDDLRRYIKLMHLTKATYDKNGKRISGNDKMNYFIKPFVIATEKGGEDGLKQKINNFAGYDVFTLPTSSPGTSGTDPQPEKGKRGKGKGKGKGKGEGEGKGKGKRKGKRQEDPQPETSDTDTQPGTSSAKGYGLKFLSSDPNALIDRFDLLFSSKKAGHTGVRNEIISILDELKRQGVININEYKKLNSLIKK